jgi:hypothetical protein
MAFMAQVEGEVMAAYLFVDGAYLRERLDDRFRESCHKPGIHLGFRTPI